MGYVNPESYYYCDGCGGKVMYHEANHVWYVKHHESGGGSHSEHIFHDDCLPTFIDPADVPYEIEVPYEFWEPGDEYMIGDGWRLNPDSGVCRAIRKRIRITGGHCPCVPKSQWNEDTLCPCAKFRNNEGCHCGLYWPVEQTLF